MFSVMSMINNELIEFLCLCEASCASPELALDGPGVGGC